MTRFAALALALLLLAPFTTPAAAQTDQRCFPETNQCIAGPIRQYWERNGGLAVFGFPITAQAQEAVEGRTLQVQWFERDRLEIQADGLVTAGRLGVEKMAQIGTPWQFGTPQPIPSNCTNFPETGHQACGIFRYFWERNGGVERFGFPISSQFFTEIEGKVYLVQYFERRRFEYHPELIVNTVLLGLLGREVYDARLSPPSLPPVTGPSVLQNGDFEQGTSEWELYDDVSIMNSPENARTGNSFALLGSTDGQSDELGQMITVSLAAPYLTYWYTALSEHADCYEDAAYIYVDPIPNDGDLGKIVASHYDFCNDREFTTYRRVTVDLRQYAGQTVKLEFRLSTNARYVSYWSIDDISLQPAP